MLENSENLNYHIILNYQAAQHQSDNDESFVIQRNHRANLSL